MYFFGQIIFTQHAKGSSKRPTRIGNCPPDDTRFPVATVGLIVFETYIKSSGGIDQ